MEEEKSIEINEAEKADKVFKTYWTAFPYNTDRSYIILECKSGCKLYIPFSNSNISDEKIQNLRAAWQKLVEIAEY